MIYKLSKFLHKIMICFLWQTSIEFQVLPFAAAENIQQVSFSDNLEIRKEEVLDALRSIKLGETCGEDEKIDRPKSKRMAV